MPTVRLKFHETTVFETLGRNLGKTYEAGKIYDVDEREAGRWLKRRKAEQVGDASSKKKEVPTSESAPAASSDEQPITPTVSGGVAGTRNGR